MNFIDLPHATIRYEAPVVYLTFKTDANLDVAEIRELIKATEKLTGKKPYLLLSDARVFINITPEARKVSADKNEAPYLVANAALINNLPLTLTTNFFIKFNRPHFKLKVFNDEKKALKWLLKFAPEE